MKQNLSEIWIKASIAGTIWAASEIVLGSFLHNLRIPLSGNILTAIGLIILISISYIWNEKGLFWRAGLICAVLKTMSPSAMIFGPMIGIFTEALLLELSVMLLGRTIAGYMTGAMLAMASNLLHRIVSYIISYGSNIVAVYADLLKMAQKQLNIRTDIVWLPIIILLILYTLFGMLSAAIGIRTGRRLLSQPLPNPNETISKPSENQLQKSGPDFNFSLVWLIVNMILIVLSFVLLNMTSWKIWTISIVFILILWSVRYKKALRQLKRPGFWIFFIVITLLAAFVFTKAQFGQNSVWVAVLTGIQMNFRAAVIVVGFAVLGTELYNPVIRSFFLKTSFKNLPLALELSVKSLPAFIASIPDFKTVIRNPVSIFYGVISSVSQRFSEINSGASDGKKFIVTGPVGAGKTTFVKKLTEAFRETNINVNGFFSERVMEGENTTGYDIVNISTGERNIFLRQNGNSGHSMIGRFSINPEGLEMGKNVLRAAEKGWEGIFIVDEVGALELEGAGWSEGLDKLSKIEKCLILTVRDTNLEKVRQKWNLGKVVIFNVNEADYRNAGSEILKLVDSMPVI